MDTTDKNFSISAAGRFKANSYRKGKMLNEGQLKALSGKRIPVWVDYLDTDHKQRHGAFEVIPTESSAVMLEDGSCFALDYEFIGDDGEPCRIEDDGMTIFEAVRHGKN